VSSPSNQKFKINNLSVVALAKSDHPSAFNLQTAASDRPSIAGTAPEM
jgi:hypothetical protein